jgi:hypothetical protein
MTQIFKKLNFKNQKTIYIVNSPVEFKHEEATMKEVTSVVTKLDDAQDVEFVLSFVKNQMDIEELAPKINSKLKGDGIVWYAYPKGSSKKYKVEINRDKGWEILGELGFEGVRSVSIDEDWSAVRFRRVEFIKVMKRQQSFAMTSKGKERTK